MSAKKGIQMEDSQTAEVEKKAQAEPKTEKKEKKTFLQIVLPWLIVAVVFFLGGVSTLYFTVYRTTKAELDAAKAEVVQSAADLDTANADLQQAKTDLADAQAALSEKTTALTKAETLELLYKFQADVNDARASLLNNDPSSARLMMASIAGDLSELQKTDIDAQSLTGLQPRIDTALQYLESDPQTAIESLRTLSTNLSVLIENQQ